ncbi:MAG: hypothetical protein ACUVTP_11515 [Candidatus Fervidibacter sp.]|uniref:hypothetical protein n=1 Tax=Candidatus Fervidibacter sp. TaxID=3100871 RepID=UPI0040499E47
MPLIKCQRVQEKKSCICSWTACEKKGNYCLCLQYHISDNELPGCFFTPEVERTYDITRWVLDLSLKRFPLRELSVHAGQRTKVFARAQITIVNFTVYVASA